MRFAPKSGLGKARLSALLLLFAAIAIVHRADCSFLITRTPVLYRYFLYSPREGDVVFQSLPHADIIDAIEGITHSPYSHCGVVLRDDQARWVVIESITNVHETPLFLWMLRGRRADFAAYRLKNEYASEIPKFKQALLSFSGRSYDFNYDMTNSHLVYCSDLVYLAFEKATGEKLGKLEKLGDLDWRPFQHFIQADQGGGLPLDRLMITPAALARANQLRQVCGY